MTGNDPERIGDEYQDELSNGVDDGSGCAEVWSALAGTREGKSDGSSFMPDRRGFISRVAMTLGIVPIGATATTSASSPDGFSNMSVDSDESGEIAPEVEQLEGKMRKDFIKSALESDKVKFVADHIGEQEKVVSAFQYTLQSGTAGYGVTLGVNTDVEGPTINYYESDAFEDETVVVGGTPAGDGFIVVDADSKLVLHVHGTPQLKKIVKDLPRNKEYSQFKNQVEEGTVRENEAIIVQGFADGDARTDILLPVVKDDEVIERVVLSGSETPTGTPIRQYSVTSSPEAKGPIQNRVAPCGPICGVLTAAGAGVCLGVCLSNPITAPYAAYCGQLCAAASAGTCIPTCNDLL